MRDHKSLLAWQEAHAVVLALLPAMRQVKHAYANPIFTQLQRAALSVQLNIAEGYALKASKRLLSSLLPHSNTATNANGCSLINHLRTA